MAGKRFVFLLFLLILVFAGSGHCWKWYEADAPETGLKGNSFVDIEYIDGIIWVATGNGLSYSDDFGQTWYTHNTQTGLSSNEPSAIFGRPGELWVSASHPQYYGDISYPFGDGIDFSSDTGNTWDTLRPPETVGYAHLVYDIAGTGTSTYAACFHGGMIVTHDGGDNWSHMYYSPADSSDYLADDWADLTTGRYYSCAVDEMHGDSTFVYGGCARGINKFMYIPRRVKMGGNNITSMAGAGEYYYMAHENGISQADTALSKFYTSSNLNGLPINGWGRRMIHFGGQIWVSMFDKTDTTGRGIYVLDNPTEQWTAFDSSSTGPSGVWSKLATDLFEGDGGGAYDFKALNDSVLYVAAGDSGLYYTLDTGQTWQKFFVDSTDQNIASLTNQVLSIDVTSDSLFVGTMGGLVKASYLAPFSIDGHTLVEFGQDDSTGSVVSTVRNYEGTTDFTWVALQPHPDSSGTSNYTAVEMIEGSAEMYWAFNSQAPSVKVKDILILSDTVTVFATSIGLIGSTIYYGPPTGNFAYVPKDDSTGLSIENASFQSLALIGDRLFAGSSGGFGYHRTNTDWEIVRANTNPRSHDLALSLTRASTGLPGDWVIAVELQETSEDTVLWAACRRVPDTLDQYNSVAYSTDFGQSWNMVLVNEQVWNFDFDANGRVYAAATSGLYYTDGSPDVWVKADIIDAAKQDTIWAETEVYSVAVVDTIVWVGTSFGMAYRPVVDIDDWRIIRVFKGTDSEDDLYAAPVPFSPLAPNGRLTLHYHVEETADITVEIYDFSMNLVARVADGKSRSGDADYFETWDGFNEDGDIVATGMYFFKVIYSTGQERWGRLAIIP